MCGRYTITIDKSTIEHRFGGRFYIAQADYDSWAHHVLPGGALAFHDIFTDPADGGQAPYNVYRRALETGQWKECRVEGSLRVLERLSDEYAAD